MSLENKSRRKEVANVMAILIFSLSLGSEYLPIEEYVQLAGDDIVDVEYNMDELVDLTWGREVHLVYFWMKSQGRGVM